MRKALKKTIILYTIFTLLILAAVNTSTYQPSTAFAASTTTKSSVVLAKVSVSVKQTAKSTVTLTWKKVSGANGYEIYRKIGAGGTYKKIKTITSGSSVTYKDSNLTLGKKYYYKVRAYSKKGGSTVRGSYSSVKAVTLTNMKPVFTVYLPTSINKTKETIVITLTNNTKSAACYIDGAVAIEDLNVGGKVYNAQILSYEKPNTGVKGKLAEGKRLLLKPGEKVRLTCKLDSSFDYDKAKVQLTTCIRYKQKNYVSVYSTEGKNRIFTAEEYYDYLMGKN